MSLAARNSQSNMCKTGPIAWLSGHDDDVNCVRWNLSSSYLASCSDDCLVKLFKIPSDDELNRSSKTSVATRDCPSMADEIESDMMSRRPSNASFNDDDTAIRDSKRKQSPSIEIDPCATLGEHLKQVYSIDWSSVNENHLASGSFDTSIKVWDIEVGKSIMTMLGSGPVYSIHWSPCGSYIASTYHDSAIKVWSVRDCECIKTWTTRSGGCVNDLVWGDEKCLVACYSDGNVGLCRI